MRSFGIVANFICPPLSVIFQDLLSKPPANYMFLSIFCFCEAVLIGFEITLYSYGTILTALVLTALLAATIAVLTFTFKPKLRINDYVIGGVIIAAVVFAYMSKNLQDYIKVHLIACWCFLSIYIVCLAKDLTRGAPGTLTTVSAVSLVVDIVGVFLSIIYMFAP